MSPPERPSGPGTRSRVLPVTFAVLAFLVLAAGAVAFVVNSRSGTASGWLLAPTSPGPSRSPDSSASPGPGAVPGTPGPDGVVPSSFPTSGPRTWVYADGPGPVLGTKGPIKRFRVAVESNIDYPVAAFAAKIDRTLGDPRSWIASGTFRLQRVPKGAKYDFTIHLATRDTSTEMCAEGYTDTDGYTSCRTVGHVIVNLDRWYLSVPDYVDAGTPLDVYRTYVINHETGHELGHGHELCPGPGQPAPVMEQQTLGLHGCIAYGWPYLNGKRYAGPPGHY